MSGQKKKTPVYDGFSGFHKQTYAADECRYALKTGIGADICGFYSKSPIYAELGTVLEDFASGLGESHAWQDFSERCKVKEISSFATMIMQNSKIGGRQLIEELKK